METMVILIAITLMVTWLFLIQPRWLVRHLPINQRDAVMFFIGMIAFIFIWAMMFEEKIDQMKISALSEKTQLLIFDTAKITLCAVLIYFLLRIIKNKKTTS